MTKPDESSFDLEQFLPFELHQASETVSQSFSKVYRDGYGMTRTEWRVFAHIGQNGSMTATEIGAASRLHKTKVSRAVYSLEKRGWLVRKESVEDRRVQTLSLSKPGNATYRKLCAEAHRFSEKVEAQIGSEEMAMALKLLRRFQQL